MVKRKRTSSYGSRKRFKYSRAFRRRLRPRFGRRRTRRAQIHRFRRTHTYDWIQVSGGTWTPGVFLFKLSDINDYTDFTALYEQYRITGVKVVFDFNKPLASTADESVYQPGVTELVPTSYGYNTRLFTTLDFNDATAPTSANDFYDDEYTKIFHLTPTRTVFKRYFVPRVRTTTDTGNLTLAKPRQWLETESGAGQLHYGMKCAMEDPRPYTKCKVEMTYYLQFRRSQ